MTSLGRRPLLKGAGVALAGLGGLTGSAAAKKYPRPLTDKGADVTVYWSLVGNDADDPNAPGDYGFPGPSDPLPPGGITFAGHDPADGGLFDFSRIVMQPNGDLTNTAFQILGGAVVDGQPSSYDLEHLGGGLYRSVGQEMRFTARPAAVIQGILNVPALPPAFQLLAGGDWIAVGDEYAKLGLVGKAPRHPGRGRPDPTDPQWAATRVDFFDAATETFALSLLYVIGADDTADPTDGIPNAAYQAAGSLILGGRLQPS